MAFIFPAYPVGASATDGTPALAAGSITILAGYSAAGKSTVGADLLQRGAALAAQDGRPVTYLLEDALYSDLGVRSRALLAAWCALWDEKKLGALVALLQFGVSFLTPKVLPPLTGIRAFYRVVQDELLHRARDAAAQGHRVIVDICPGDANQFLTTLARHNAAAAEARIPTEARWLTCPAETRAARLRQRGTRFDEALVSSPHFETYLQDVAHAEAHILSSGVVRGWQPPVSPQPGARASADTTGEKDGWKAGWAARAHMLLLRRFVPAA